MDKEPITVSGLQKLQKELEEIKNIKRPKIIAAIAEARGHGDLKENAEYHAAKEQQGHVETRILQINARVVRNLLDTKRKNSPLLRHPESIEIDSGKLTKQAMLKKMSKYVERLLN